MESWIEQIFNLSGISADHMNWLFPIAQGSAVIVLALVANLITHKFLFKGIRYLVAQTHTSWDDILLKQGALQRSSYLAPSVIIYIFAQHFGALTVAVEKCALIAIVIITVRLLDEILNGLVDIYQVSELSKDQPIRGYAQVVKITAYLVSAIFIVAILLNKQPWSLLTGLGAMSAIFLLVFKDSILGFIAAIQIASYNMVRRGDWIEMPKYSTDGEVLDVSLHTVKVQNWDKTISTIPTQAFINESFKNWRGMEESEGRRIKRAISIDMDSIRFCNHDFLAKLSNSIVIGEYIRKKQQEVNDYNSKKGYQQQDDINSRRLTNIGTFRAYVESYLRGHEEINPDMTFLVRQLAPSEKGLPIEIYVFCKDQRWAHYEAIQADIFDHLIAVLPEFHLRVYQNPSAACFDKLKI